MNAAALALHLLVLFAVLRASKLGRAPFVLGDLLWGATLSGATHLALQVGHPGLAMLGALLIMGLTAALLLDLVMWRAFTVELGPRGTRDVVLAVLLRELGELGWVRRFLRRHRALFLLPALALALGTSGLLPPAARPAADLALTAALGGLVLGGPARAAPWAWGALLAAPAAGWVPALGTPPAALLTLSLGTIGLLCTRPLRARGLLPGSTVGDFLLPRPRRRATRLHPRPEHQGLLTLAPRAPRPSPLFGRLRGADVLLVTVESLGSAHLADRSPGGARTPFLDHLRQAGLSSGLHLSPSPTTNHAHEILYTGSYRRRPSLLRALAAAGYDTSYLTSAATAYYGLRRLVEGAGMGRIIDRRDLGGPGDRALVRAAPALLAALPGPRRPRFVHVMTSDSHVPYTLPAGERPSRDVSDDRERYLHLLEATDALLRALVEGLCAAGALADPLVIVTGDHGQSFGALGYLTHGSAVTCEQLEVPLAMMHPALAPARAPWSSHLDLLPTVLDLLGVECPPCFGAPLLAERPPHLILWAGHPSRSTTSCFGALAGEDKYMVDLVLDQAWHLGWRDEAPRALAGAERRYVEGLLGAALGRLEIE